MPELPDVVVYVERLAARVGGERLEGVRLASPFVLRSVDPPIGEVAGKRVVGVRRQGKRIVVALEGDLFLVIHLMIAGRLRWREAGAAVPKKRGLAAFDFGSGTVLFTEEGSKKRASLHVVRGEAALGEHDPGGLEVLQADRDAFVARLLSESHTLKRSLTTPRLFSGIGNAYSDEILHRARLSPVKVVGKLSEAELDRLWEATRAVLEEWTDRLREEVGDGFPEKVTAFRDGMAVHGRYGQPCPECGAPIQRITYVEKNEVSYCARCQTGGKLLSDRSLARLLKDDWPRTIEELEERQARRAARGGRKRSSSG